jgi:DNA-binding SARP family transcriptional activator
MPPFLVLGPLEVQDAAGVPIRMNRRKVREVLALLLLRPGVVVDVEEIVDALWGEQPPASARANLYSYVSDLRRVLAVAAPADQPRPSHVRNGYRLDLRVGECDAYLFEELAASGRRALRDGRFAAAGECLASALGLWRGRVLHGIDAEFCADAATRLEQTRLGAEEDYVDARLGLGQHEELAIELEAAVRRHPLRERMWGQFMVALCRAGRRADALRAYHRIHDELDAELGIGPCAELRTLHRAIVSGHPVRV